MQDIAQVQRGDGLAEVVDLVVQVRPGGLFPGVAAERD